MREVAAPTSPDTVFDYVVVQGDQQFGCRTGEQALALGDRLKENSDEEVRVFNCKIVSDEVRVGLKIAEGLKAVRKLLGGSR